ncbi:unnamed protein product [Lactuca virosa]|uniref:Uncharacterized protein n=1 Tax=Lactuca virosa TaxID=75947 RepID=A0AAU9M060_9ASTR|nr:unnamed protein product [Lactuca virosa]
MASFITPPPHLLSSSLQSRYRASLSTTITTLNSASFLSLHPLCFLKWRLVQVKVYILCIGLKPFIW